MLAEFAVVEADHQPQPGVEAAGAQGGVDVGLVVVVDEGQRLGGVDPGHGERLVVGGRGVHHADLARAPGLLRRGRRGGAISRARAAVAVHHGGDAAQQQGGAARRAGGAGQAGAAALGAGRGQQDHTDPVHVGEFGGEPLGERVVPADHHVRGGGRGLTGQRGGRGRGEGHGDRVPYRGRAGVISGCLGCVRGVYGTGRARPCHGKRPPPVGSGRVPGAWPAA